MPRRILLLGPPGSGKGTQAALISTALGIPHISTGEMLRDAVSAGTELGAKAEALMAAGDFVPDDFVVAIVDERLRQDDAQSGFLLDGFPRNVVQAEALGSSSAPDIGTVILLEVDTDEIVKRLMKRGAEQGRADDNEETVRRRLEIYQAETAPLVEFYGSLVLAVDGIGTIDDVFARVALALSGS